MPQSSQLRHIRFSYAAAPFLAQQSTVYLAMPQSSQPRHSQFSYAAPFLAPHPTQPSRNLLSYAGTPNLATPHSSQLHSQHPVQPSRCLLSQATNNLVTPYPTELYTLLSHAAIFLIRHNQLSYAAAPISAPYSAPHPTQPRRNLLSHAAPNLATPHPSQLNILLSHAPLSSATPHPAIARTTQLRSTLSMPQPKQARPPFENFKCLVQSVINNNRVYRGLDMSGSTNGRPLFLLYSQIISNDSTQLALQQAKKAVQTTAKFADFLFLL